MNTAFLTPEQSAKLITSDSTLVSVGMTLIGASESILSAIEKDFLETGQPNNLTPVHASGQCNREHGIQHFAHEGLVTRIIGSHWGLDASKELIGLS